MSSTEAVEILSSLLIFCGTKSNNTNCSRSHRVVKYLCVCTSDPNSALQCFLTSSLMAMSMVLGLIVPWWAIPGGMEFSQNMLLYGDNRCGQAFEWWWIDCSSGAFLYCLNIPFYFRYMHIVGGSVERYAHVGYDTCKSFNLYLLIWCGQWTFWTTGRSW